MNGIKHKVYSATECLSEKTMFDYIDNKLTAKERHLAEKHMLDCELCSDAMEGLELVKDRSRIRSIKNAVDSGILSKKETRIISINYKTVLSIAAAISLLVAGVFFFKQVASKSMESTDMAEVKTDAASPLPPPASEAADELTGTATKIQDEKEGSAKRKEALLESSKSVTDEEIAEYKKNESPVENTRGIISGEGAANGTYQLDQTATTADDRFAATMPAQSEADNKMMGGAFEREKNSPEDKKPEQKAAQENVTYTWSTGSNTVTAPENTLEEKQLQNNKNAEGDGNIALAKKAESGKYRSETKGKMKDQSKAPRKENRADEDIALSGTVAYEPQSVSQDKDKEELKSQVTTKETAAKTDSISSEEAYVTADEMPQFPGGTDSMMRFISTNFKYPAFKQENESIKTKIFVQFIVGRDGVVRNAKIIKGINPELDKEALRVVSMMPKWKAGKQNGKTVSVIYNLPIQLEIK